MNTHPLWRITAWSLVLAAGALAPGSQAAEISLLATNAEWRFVKGTNEASSPDPTAWRSPVFDDSAWSNAPAPFHLGRPWAGTPLVDMGTNYTCIFLRRTLVVTNLPPGAAARLEAWSDDGFIAWINGVEVARANVLPATPPFNGSASREVLEPLVPVAVSVSNATQWLQPGTNVLAVQALNFLGSTDFVFTASLRLLQDDVPPVVQSRIPSAGTTVRIFSRLEVVFDEAVRGVDATDLLINGLPATRLTRFSDSHYLFEFPQPAPGLVQVAWSASHGIADLAPVPNAFAGGAWSYLLDPAAPVERVIISEFMAMNQSTLQDENGDYSDWIELFNAGSNEVDLRGWYLTDTTANLVKWAFPSTNLPPNGFLVVFASGKNRRIGGRELHTSFSLGGAGEYLALVLPDGLTVATEYAPVYPAQTNDIAYGMAMNGFTVLTNAPEFLGPTPGGPNNATSSSPAPVPVFSLESGLYTNDSLTLIFSAPPDMQVRYTFDGSIPTFNSAGGPGPVSLTSSTNMIIKARVFQSSNPWPGPVASRKFILLDGTTANFSSDLPIVILSTQGRTISGSQVAFRTRGQVAAIATHRGRAALTGPVDTHEFSTHEIRNGTSWLYPTRPHRVEMNDDLGNDKAVSILGLPAEADWYFQSPYADKSLMNDFLAHELWEDMGHYACRRRYVELFVDTGGGKLTYPGDYYGVMVLLENIEIGTNRVDLARLDRSDILEPAISGGYIFKKDDVDFGDYRFGTPGGAGFASQVLTMQEPRPEDLNNNANHPQMIWLRNYLNLFEAALYSPSWTNATGTNHYSHYIDVDRFVDQHLHVEFTWNSEGYRLSSYFSKDRSGRFGPGPIWDWDVSFGNTYFSNGGLTNDWYFGFGNEDRNPWLRRLNFGGTNITLTSGGDPEFRQRITDRWAVLRINTLNGPRVATRIEQIATSLTEAAGRNFSKYNILNINLFQSATGGVSHVDYTQPTYPLIISEMKKWVLGRYAWMDDQFMKAPLVSLNGGLVPVGTTFTMSAAEGSIYYTTNGTDPRAVGGGISPSAIAYTPGSPVTISGNTRLFARAYNAATIRWTRWSPPLEITYVVRTNRFVITEIMYAPAAPPAGSSYSAEDFEYIELRNVDGGLLNVTGSRLSGGIGFTFPSLTLADGQRVLVVRNLAAFSSRYDTNGLLIAGEFSGALANEGERIVLTGPVGEKLLDFDYDNQWHPITEGLGFSLVIKDDSAPLDTWGLDSSWRFSGTVSGSPGRENGPPAIHPPVLVNEVLSNPVPPAEDIIELHNPTAQEVDIGGWYLSDDFKTPAKFRFSPATFIPAGGYLAIDEHAFNPVQDPPLPGAFSLRAAGDEIHLFSADAEGRLTGYHHEFEFGAAAANVPFGRHTISTGADHFVAQVSATPSAANSGPLVDPVVISEIHFHPPDIVNPYGTFDNPEEEYIELRNITDQPVPFSGPSNSTGLWRLRGSVEFTFPTNLTLAAGQHLLVVGFDPERSPGQRESFRATHAVPPGVPMVGPYRGPLPNHRGTVRLGKPFAPVPAAQGDSEVFITVDQVNYFSSAAGGTGLSLQRRIESAYGDDPANWVAVGRSPGYTHVAGSTPVITAHPRSATVFSATPVTLSVEASGTPPLSYQWRFRPIDSMDYHLKPGATASRLTIEAASAADAGDYDCVVANLEGAVASSNATITVLIPPTIVSHPINVSLKVPPDPAAASNRVAVFRVIATTFNPPLIFHWQRDGTNLPMDEPRYLGVNSDILTITNVVREDTGLYRCAVTDAIGTIYSSNALLQTLVRPILIQHPQSQTILQGDPVTFTVGISNVCTGPFTYVWRYQSFIIASNHMVPDYFSTLTVTNVALQVSNVNRYRCDVQSPATLGQGLASTSAFITVLPDADRDRIDDNWEVLHGLMTNDAADAQSDLDGDRMSNLNEFRSGTDPTDPASVLKVTDFQYGPTSQFNFLAISNRTYSVLYADGLPETPWSKLADVSAEVTNRVLRVEDPGPVDRQRFYRIVTPRRE